MDLKDIFEKSIERRLTDLKMFTSSSGNGVTRLPFSEEGKRAADYLKDEMESVGLTVQIDMVGNVRGRLDASVSDAKTIIIGSHYDTVKNGGEYDGISGVVCAIDIADFINKTCTERKYALEIIAFNDEEGMMFGSGCLGSKAVIGDIDQGYISNLKDENGVSIKEWIVKWGGNPDRLDSLKMNTDKIKAFFEIHIEQGPVLYQEKKKIGIVNCIVGLLRCMVTIKGRADHAGTTPMNMRRDSLNIASKVISCLDEFANSEGNGSVATSGFIRAYPNAINVIPEKVEFTIDIRSSQQESIDNIEEKVIYLLDKYTKNVGATYDLDIKLQQLPVYMDVELMNELLDKCLKYNYEYKKMVSGAAHDAMIFADKVETAVIFVPSINGRSHCKEEYSKYSDLACATQITYETILKMIMDGE